MSISNTTDPNDFSVQSMLLPPSTTEYTFTGVPLGRTYIVTVTAINGVGSSVTFFVLGEQCMVSVLMICRLVRNY